MDITRLPLAERIRRCQEGRTAYPEYIPSIILNFTETPVMDYLACVSSRNRQRFSSLTGIRGRDCTYQQAALLIERLPFPPDADEAARILAKPMVRYDALTRETQLPPPACEPPPPRSAPGEKLPLAERLRNARQGEEQYLHIYRLYVDTYCYNLDIIAGGHCNMDTLDVVLAPYLNRYEAMPLLTRVIADSRDLTAIDQTQLLFQLLIRPFAALQKEKERIEKECMSLPF